jgi:2-(1,2-epoxy-1,2-dihydrophenyl)acetyl-CoA isomerase
MSYAAGMADVLLVDRADGVATLTLNRPESMNSLSTELKEALLAALADVGSDRTVRAVVLTGNGRGFCVGQDLAEHVQLLEADDPAPLSTVEQHYNPITLALAELAKPVIAAVNGMAAGAGASFAFACDLRVVSEQAKFLLAFANVGLSLDSGASWTLPRLIGAGRAAELCLLARPITAQQAADYGLVTQLVPAEQVLPVAQELAATLAAGPTTAYAAIKRALHFSAGHSLRESLANEAVEQAIAGSTADHRAATFAFVKKEKPVFTGE